MEKIYDWITNSLLLLIVFGLGVLLGSQWTLKEVNPVIEKLTTSNQSMRQETMYYKGHIEAIEGLRNRQAGKK